MVILILKSLKFIIEVEEVDGEEVDEMESEDLTRYINETTEYLENAMRHVADIWTIKVKRNYK